MLIMLGLLVGVSVVCKILFDELRWVKSRMDYWYEQSRFWQEMWEAERTGDYAKLREVQELRRIAGRSEEP